VLHGYCLRRAGDPEPPGELRGVQGAPVLLVECEALGLWVSELPARPAAELPRLREHDAVMRAALRGATPLPLRFGAAWPDATAAREFVRARAEEFGTALAEVAGRVEIGIRVSAAEGAEGAEPQAEAAGTEAPAPLSIRSGRDYLEARRAALRRSETQRARAAAALDAVEARLEGLFLRARRDFPSGTGPIATVAHLVHTDHLSEYRERVRGVRDAYPGLTLVFTGPWAPYSFV
jgi:pyruvate/2-oxoglutarate dehydrogenase complex dihydrolipoamide acyltransferase (E2) component